MYLGVPLYRFRLQNSTAGAVSVTSLRLRAPSVRGIASADLSSLRIHDGTSDVATGGVPAMGRTTGTITFTPGAWTVPASSTVDYTVWADVGALAGYDTLFLSLAAADVVASTTVSGGTLSRARHVADTALGAGPKLARTATRWRGAVLPRTSSTAPTRARGPRRRARRRSPTRPTRPGGRSCASSRTSRSWPWSRATAAAAAGRRSAPPSGTARPGTTRAAAPRTPSTCRRSPCGTDAGVNRSYDAAYEAMSGRLLVVLGDQHDQQRSATRSGTARLGRATTRSRASMGVNTATSPG